MSMLEVTLTHPVHGGTSAEATAIDRESQSQSFTFAQSFARVVLTLAAMGGMSALFASQVYATLR